MYLGYFVVYAGLSLRFLLFAVCFLSEMCLHKRLDARPDVRDGDAAQTKRFGKPAIVRARLVGTGLALENFRGRVERREPLMELRAEQGERRPAARRRQMAGAGVVADEHARPVQAVQQFGDVLRTDDGLAARATSRAGRRRRQFAR